VPFELLSARPIGPFSSSNSNEAGARFGRATVTRQPTAFRAGKVKLVKFQGIFPWHSHEGEDEMFLVWRGQMKIEFRDHEVELGPAKRAWCRGESSIEHWLRCRRRW